MEEPCCAGNSTEEVKGDLVNSQVERRKRRLVKTNRRSHREPMKLSSEGGNGSSTGASKALARDELRSPIGFNKQNA